LPAATDYGWLLHWQWLATENLNVTKSIPANCPDSIRIVLIFEFENLKKSRDSDFQEENFVKILNWVV